MEYLYVALFSNGHIKVGRSIDPRARISAHADRVACLGVELVGHHIVECASDCIRAEAELIALCAQAGIKRNKNEWFEGLDHVDVCAWADICARKVFEAPESTGIRKAVDAFGGSASKLANAIGNGVLRQHIEHWLASGRVPAEKCPDVFAATGVPLEELNDKTNWAIVRGESPASSESV